MLAEHSSGIHLPYMLLGVVNRPASSTVWEGGKAMRLKNRRRRSLTDGRRKGAQEEEG